MSSVVRMHQMLSHHASNIHSRHYDQEQDSWAVCCESKTDDSHMDHALPNVAVIGLPDREWGEVVAAFVQVRSGTKPDGVELEAFCRRHLASHKVPRLWR